MMAESINTSEVSTMTIFNLFVQILKNTQPPKPAPCLALRPFSIIFLFPKYSKNKQIKNAKSTSAQPNLRRPYRPNRRGGVSPPIEHPRARNSKRCKNVLGESRFGDRSYGGVFWYEGSTDRITRAIAFSCDSLVSIPDATNIRFCIDIRRNTLYYIK